MREGARPSATPNGGNPKAPPAPIAKVMQKRGTPEKAIVPIDAHVYIKNEECRAERSRGQRGTNDQTIQFMYICEPEKYARQETKGTASGGRVQVKASLSFMYKSKTCCCEIARATGW